MNTTTRGSVGNVSTCRCMGLWKHGYAVVFRQPCYDKAIVGTRGGSSHQRHKRVRHAVNSRIVE